MKRRAFEQVLEYLYTDRVNWDKDTDRGLIEETKEVRGRQAVADRWAAKRERLSAGRAAAALPSLCCCFANYFAAAVARFFCHSQAAQYFHIKRLEAICDQYLDSSKNVAVPESTWWKNMKWVFENLREGDFAMSDLTLICRGDGYDVPVPCHAIVLTAACKYFHGMLLGEVNNEEKKTMQIVVEEATEKQMLSILKYIYTREFDVDIGDVVGVWILANKFLLEDLQVECERYAARCSLSLPAS